MALHKLKVIFFTFLTVGQEFWTQEWEWRDRVRALLERLPELHVGLIEAVASFPKATA